MAARSLGASSAAFLCHLILPARGLKHEGRPSPSELMAAQIDNPVVHPVNLSLLGEVGATYTDAELAKAACEQCDIREKPLRGLEANCSSGPCQGGIADKCWCSQSYEPAKLNGNFCPPGYLSCDEARLAYSFADPSGPCSSVCPGGVCEVPADLESKPACHNCAVCHRKVSALADPSHPCAPVCPDGVCDAISDLAGKTECRDCDVCIETGNSTTSSVASEKAEQQSNEENASAIRPWVTRSP